MLGTDIIEIARVGESAKNSAFMSGVFTESERAYYEAHGKKAETLAGMFCAKEAVAKALGTGFRGFRPNDIEIYHDEAGAPQVRLLGSAKEKFPDAEPQVSISHCKEYATAVCILGGGGHSADAARNYTGKLTDADIRLLVEGKAKIITEADVEIRPRKTVSHKYDYGRVRVIAGSPEMIGAALLAHESAAAALRSGAGLATLCVPDSLRFVYQSRVKEETLCFLPDRDGKIIFERESLDGLFVKTDAILIGPGMGDNCELIKIIEYIKDNFAGTLVIDADGLNALAGKTDILREHKSKIILTPHMGEFARLTAGLYVDEIPVTERVCDFASRIGGVVAAKSATTVISDGKRVYFSTTGTPALAKGGSGDVLGGMIASFACRYSPIEAAMRGCYYFGKCAEDAQKSRSAESLLASDVIIGIPDIL